MGASQSSKFLLCMKKDIVRSLESFCTLAVCTGCYIKVARDFVSIIDSDCLGVVWDGICEPFNNICLIINIVSWKLWEFVRFIVDCFILAKETELLKRAFIGLILKY